MIKILNALRAENVVIDIFWLILKYLQMFLTSFVVFCCLWYEHTKDTELKIVLVIGWWLFLIVILYPYRSEKHGRIKKLFDRTLLFNFILVIGLFFGQAVAPKIVGPLAAFAYGGINSYNDYFKQEMAWNYADNKCPYETMKDFDVRWDCRKKAHDNYMKVK